MHCHVIHIYGLSKQVVEIFKSVFPDREIRLLNRKEELLASMDNIEVLFVFRPPKGIWSGAKRLRLIQTAGAGVDTVLPAPDLPLSVRITNARGAHGDQMSEHALAMMLAFAKNLPQALEDQRSCHWGSYLPSSLVGKTCSVLGMGAIGQAVAKRAKQFGMRVVGTQREPKTFQYADEVLPPEQTDRALREADYVVVVLPLTPQTRNLLDTTLLSNLRPDAVLINMARGGILDEMAIANMLRTGRLRGAALDVFKEEPLPKSSDLWAVPNLIITPHRAGQRPGYIENVVRIFADNIGRLENGEPLKNEIDRNRGY